MILQLHAEELIKPWLNKNYFRPFLQEQVAPLKVRRIVTNAVSWCQKCAQDRRSEVVGFDVMSHVALSELLEARL